MKYRKVFFGAMEATLALLVTLAALNVGAFFYLKHIAGVDIYDSAAYDAYRRRMTASGADTLTTPSLVHPFIGKLEFGDERYASALSTEPLFARVDKSPDPDDIKVLILGGSVALATSLFDNAGIFADKLNRHFETTRFSVYNAAVPGGKQPGQYFKLVYFDLLGFRPDVVVNIDGFNEIALPLYENFNLKNPAIFPRAFSAHVDSASDYARSCLETSDRFMAAGTRLPVVALGYDFYARRCKEGIEKVTLPWWRDLMKTPDFATYVKQSETIWRVSSNKMQAFSSSHGIDYLHVLQPNQYYPGSKIFSDWEKENAVNLPIYGDIIRQYYRLLPGEGLEDENFYDQRMAFQNMDATLYVDNCCHFNRAGNEALVEDIIRRFEPIFQRRLRGEATGRR